MNCRVVPLANPFSYQVKCVAVESERVLEESTDRKHKRKNLVKEYLQGPNFLELNRRRDAGRRSSIAVLPREKSRLEFRVERSRSLDFPQDSLSEEETVSVDSYEERKFKVGAFLKRL